MHQPTPGPWETNGSLILGNDGKTAVCQIGKAFINSDERRSNERLIVNADAMHGMIARLVAHWDGPESDTLDEAKRLLDIVEGRK